MDNKTFQEAQEKLNQVMEDKEYNKLQQNKERIVRHLNQPEQQLLDAYYNNILSIFKNELAYRYVDKHDRDISDLIRGKITILEQILGMKSIFDGVEKLKAVVAEGQKGVK